MARCNRLSPASWLTSVAAGSCMFLLRHTGGGVIAQANGGNSSVSSSTASDYPACLGYTQHIRDGYCDADLNNADCDFDGGDCCVCTCGASGEELTHTCGENGDGYDCKDPEVPADCGVTPSPAASFGYPDCAGYMAYWQDSYCDEDLNNAACGYDGGDCCRCTCREYAPSTSFWTLYSDTYWGYSTDGSISSSDTCGVFGYDCKDPDASDDCATDGPTPSPSVGDGSTIAYDDTFFFGSCPWSSDGECDGMYNTADCGWDGGDCCQCDCLNLTSTDYPCGISGYNCLDPDSSCLSSSSGSGWSFYHDDASYLFNSPGYSRTSSTEDDDGDDSSEQVFSSAQMASMVGVSVGVFCVLGCIPLAALAASRRRSSREGSATSGGADQPNSEDPQQPPPAQEAVAVEPVAGEAGAPAVPVLGLIQ